MALYLIYVDDSGDERRTLFSALAIPSEHWGKCLDMWLGWRKRTLHRSYGLPASYELHGVNWLKRRPGDAHTVDGLRQLLGDDGVALIDKDGSAVTVLSEHRFARRERARQYDKALSIISGFPGAFCLTVHWEGSSDKSHLYEQLLADLENRLGTENAEGIVLLDGLDPGPHFRRRHRDLPIKSRRVLEDPIPMSSAASQLVQMADLCAHAAFRYKRARPDDLSRLAYERLGAISDSIHDTVRKT